MKRNVTVVLSDETARWLRVEAARQDVSVSQYLGAVVERERKRSERYEEAKSSYLSRPPRLLGTESGLPTRSSLHER